MRIPPVTQIARGEGFEYPPDRKCPVVLNGSTLAKFLDIKPNRRYTEIMSATHDYETTEKQAQHLTNADVLVGECGGLSAVFSIDGPTRIGWSMVVIIETEHGNLLVAPEKELEVLDGIDLECYND